jgi:predicted hotdog family 3-hydroxylacyl-ACP dehydratase
MPSHYPPIEELIPHSGPMVLVDELVRWAEGEAACNLRVREHAPFVADGKVESAVTIEYMAQTVAACLGYEALRGGAGVRVGMIIACKRFVAHGDALAVGDELSIDVKRVRGNEMLSHFDCRVLRAGVLFSEAVLTLYHAEKPPDEAS